MKHFCLVFLLALSTFAQNAKSSLPLMPWPQKIELQTGNFVLTPRFNLSVSGNPNSRVFNAATNFLRRLDGRTGMFFKQGFVTTTNEYSKAQLQIQCAKPGVIDLYQDESYQLKIDSNQILITATSDLGAMHGLETLLQLLTVKDGVFSFPNVVITDMPRFTWRGLMIDVARHFQPVEVIKRNLDAMAAFKMNVFHWHLVDDQGWRIEMKKHKVLTDKASDGMFYTQEEIKNVVKYAADRGILVVPEIDVPGHASAILTAFPEIGSKVVTVNKGDAEQNQKVSALVQYTLERNAGVFSPTLDPSNPKTYQILSEIFDEVCPLFSGKYFHIGGDENEGKDWDSNPKIQEFMKKNKLANNHELQTYFTMQLVPMLQKHGKALMGWEEIMTKNLSKSAIIHSWKGVNEGVAPGSSLVKAVKNGYKTVLSNGYYIDLVQGVAQHYLVDPMPNDASLTADEKSRILGGEATMWSELVTPTTIDSRIWPRTAAIAERLWSDAKVNDVVDMRQRLQAVTNRLEELGISHLKNKEMLLRNLSNYQDVTSLQTFSAICEPLKIYSRNAGGTEYQMYSPLTLFADACTPDAEDALIFDQLVSDFVTNKDSKKQETIVLFLEKWIANHKQLEVLSERAPLVSTFLPLSQSLKDLSVQLLLKLKGQQSVDSKNLNELLIKCNSKEHADVELAVYASLKRLVEL